jgi:hypothetical protein
MGIGKRFPAYSVANELRYEREKGDEMIEKSEKKSSATGQTMKRPRLPRASNPEKYIYLFLVWLLFSSILWISLLWGILYGWDAVIPGRGGGYSSKNGVLFGLASTTMAIGITVAVFMKRSKTNKKKL